MGLLSSELPRRRPLSDKEADDQACFVLQVKAMTGSENLAAFITNVLVVWVLGSNMVLVLWTCCLEPCMILEGVMGSLGVSGH